MHVTSTYTYLSYRIDDARLVESDSLKRRLSLSEVLSNQKKMRPDKQTVRNSFGGASQAKPVLPFVDAKPQEVDAVQVNNHKLSCYKWFHVYVDYGVNAHEG